LCYNILQMRRVWLLLGLLFLVVLAAAAYFLVFNQFSRVSIKVNSEYQETTYAIISEGATCELTTYQTELNKDVMTYRSNAKTINRQLEPIYELFKTVKKREGRLPPILYWYSHQSYPEFYQRVKSAAKKGMSAEQIIKLANDNQSFFELEALLAHMGYSLKVSGVEKVLLEPQTKLPYDFMLWFRVEKKGQGDK